MIADRTRDQLIGLMTEILSILDEPAESLPETEDESADHAADQIARIDDIVRRCAVGGDP